MSLSLPKHVKTDSGQERHVGFEFEYSGISLDDSVEIVANLIKGQVNKQNAFLYEVVHDQYGAFSVEIDAALLKEEKYKDFLSGVGIELEEVDKEEKLEELLKDLAATLVPIEIVTPPLPMSTINLVDNITNALREARAKGSSASIFYAFGLHMNPEIVSREARYLLSHIRAFALLYDWICAVSDVDISRRVTGYIKEYPGDYLRLILDHEYEPPMNTLMQDYLRLVGSRNFALDMLPCFADIDKTRVMREAKEPDLVKPRPAFHYRLANCLIDEKDWSVGGEWTYWLAIEELSADTDRLFRMMEDYWKKRRGSLFASRGKWVKHVAGMME